MPYSESLARRIRDQVGRLRGVSEKKMFGGGVFMLHGNLLVGVWQNSLLARIGPDRYAAALAQPNVAKFDATGRPMKGWVVVEPDGLASDGQLREWIDQAVEYVGTLPRK